MTTLRLLFGTTWRGAAWGLLVGTIGGSAFGALFGNALVFGVGLMRQPADLGLSDIPTAIAAMAVLALIGSVMGALFGVPTGFVVGLLNGLLVGLITRMFFFPLRDAKRYRRVIALASAVFTTSASWLGFFAIMLFYANRDKANVGALALAVTLPALIAGVAAGLISQIGARWYEHESAKVIAQNVSPN